MSQEERKEYLKKLMLKVKSHRPVSHGISTPISIKHKYQTILSDKGTKVSTFFKLDTKVKIKTT